MYKKLKELGLSSKASIHYIKSHSEEYIKEKISLTEKKMNTGGMKNLGGFLSSALDDDWQPGKNETEELKKKRTEAEQLKQREEEQEKEKEREEKQADNLSARLRKDYLATLSKVERVELLAELKEINPVMRKLVKDLDSGIIATQINERIPDFENKLAKLVEESRVIDAEPA